MYIVNKTTYPDSPYGKIKVNITERNLSTTKYRNVVSITVDDNGVMEMDFNDGGCMIRNINRNVIYSIELIKKVEETDDKPGY